VEENNKSLFLFFAQVFIFSLVFWGLGLLRPVELLPGLPISALGAFTPALSAIILLYRKDRLPGVFHLLRRSFDFQRVKNKGWLLIVLGINPIITSFAYLRMRATDASMPDPAQLTFGVLPLVVVFLIGALGEELGWTGYAMEPLQQDWGIFTASLFLGCIWAVWHYVPLLQAHRSWAWIAWWSLGTVSLRLIMGWLYGHTGQSVFAAALFHAMVNLCWQLFPVSGSFYDPAVFGILTFGCAILLLAADRLVGKSTLQPA
jgi:membrane protease YdiL (CAAX protease family)